MAKAKKIYGREVEDPTKVLTSSGKVLKEGEVGKTMFKGKEVSLSFHRGGQNEQNQQLTPAQFQQGLVGSGMAFRPPTTQDYAFAPRENLGNVRQGVAEPTPSDIVTAIQKPEESPYYTGGDPLQQGQQGGIGNMLQTLSVSANPFDERSVRSNTGIPIIDKILSTIGNHPYATAGIFQGIASAGKSLIAGTAPAASEAATGQGGKTIFKTITNLKTGKVQRLAINTKTAKLTASYISKLVSTLKNPTLVGGLIASLFFPTLWSMNEKGDVVDGIRFMYSQAKDDPEMLAKLDEALEEAESIIPLIPIKGLYDTTKGKINNARLMKLISERREKRRKEGNINPNDIINNIQGTNRP